MACQKCIFLGSPCSHDAHDQYLFNKTLSDGTSISGVRGADWHVHNTGLGIGHIKDQKTGEKFTFNNFNRTVDELLLPWMKK